MKLITATFILGAAWVLAVQGAEIYRWTDESGKTHLSDTVPARYKDAAARIDSKSFDLSLDQQRDAQARAAAEKASADAQKPRAGATLPLSLSPPPVIAPAAPSAAKQDCDAQWRDYRESLECFAPFMGVDGALKPNAFAACGRSIVQPSCESPRTY
jgi:Domain of unknown function (DUF4124)